VSEGKSGKGVRTTLKLNCTACALRWAQLAAKSALCALRCSLIDVATKKTDGDVCRKPPARACDPSCERPPCVRCRTPLAGCHQRQLILVLSHSALRAALSQLRQQPRTVRSSCRCQRAARRWRRCAGGLGAAATPPRRRNLISAAWASCRTPCLAPAAPRPARLTRPTTPHRAFRTAPRCVARARSECPCMQNKP
jgi:hypothetical protein